MIDSGNDPVFLSPEGRARKEAILQDLQKTLVRRRRARRGIAAASLLAAGLALSRLFSPAPAPLEGIPVRPAYAHISFEEVRTAPLDPSILITGDEALQELLAEANQPIGLIRIDGKLVTEFELAQTASMK